MVLLKKDFNKVAFSMSKLVVDNLFSEVKQYNFNRYSPLHYHETIELYYLVNGKVKYFIDEKSYDLNKGDLIIIPKGVLHSTVSEESDFTERLLLSFNEKNYSQDVVNQLNYLCEKKLIRIPKDSRLFVEDMFYKINDEWKKNDSCKKVMLKIYITELIVYLYRHRIHNQVLSKPTDDLIQSISNYISLNYNKEITLATLSKTFSISESYISRRFKSVVGTNVNEYINYIRINRAEKILMEKELTMVEISEMCGFNDSSYFSAIFKKLKGVTPYKFMKQHHKKF